MPVSVHVRGDAARTARVDQCVAAVFDELVAVDLLFSTYRADSEVSRIDRGELSVSAAHPLVQEVVDLCTAARLRTDGAFDADRWDETSGRRRFDPTGLVKGWAVERAAAHLATGTGCDVSVNVAGDVAGRVADPSGTPWRIGVEDPADPSRVLAVLPVLSGGVATSGTAHRGGHIVRPRDGWPVHDLLSVTVVGPSLMWADVYATAAFVRGRGARSWLETLPGYEGVVVDRAGVAVTTGLETPTPR